MHIVDLNCDMGESFGEFKMGHDEEILDFVTSANIACGFHAGDPATMRKTVKLALEKNVGIGASRIARPCWLWQKTDADFPTGNV